MTSLFNSVKAGGRAAVVALALGAASVAAMPAPAMAASPSFQFKFGISGGSESGGGYSLSFGNNGVRIKRACLSDREIRRGLRDEGWSDIEFLDRSGKWVRVLAEWDDDGRDYTMRINRCTGKVRDIKRVRRHSDGPGSGLTLEFSF